MRNFFGLVLIASSEFAAQWTAGHGPLDTSLSSPSSRILSYSIAVSAFLPPVPDFIRAKKMLIGGTKSNATKDLLRSMLHAWYDLTKDDAGEWTTELEQATLQQISNPGQVTKLIREVLFHAWRQYATSPHVRLERKNRPAQTTWVQRMMAPKNRAARGAEEGDRGGGSGCPGNEPGPLEATLEKEVVVGAIRSGRRQAQGCHPLGSRYFRVQTIPPDTIRYGRNPGSPAPPQPVPPSADHRPTAAACRRSWGKRLQNGRIRRSESTTARRDADKFGKANHPGHQPASGTTSSCGSSSSRSVGRRRRRSRRSASLRGEGDKQRQRRDEGSDDASDNEDDDSHHWHCPHLAWDELEPWEQRNPRAPWMMPSSRGGWELRSGMATQKKLFVAASMDKVLGQVTSRLNRFTSIDRRHQKVTALLLLQDGGEGGLGSTSSSGRVSHHPSHNRRFRFPTDRTRLRTGPQSRFSAGSEGGKPNSRRNHEAAGLAPHAARNNSRGGNSSGNVLMPGGEGALMTMLSKVAVDGVGREIAQARKGRKKMSDGTCCSELRLPPSSSLPQGPFDADETRGVLFGFGARRGRFHHREDRWL